MLGRGKHGHGHGDRGAQAAALAAKLGVDEAKVTDALRAFREANRPAGPRTDGQKPDRAAMEAALAASLAKSLGIDEAKVKTALEELRTEAQKSRAAALKPRLDQAVADGTLTQAEADAVTKAVEQGVIGGGRTSLPVAAVWAQAERLTAARTASPSSAGLVNWGQCPVGRSTNSTSRMRASSAT